MDNNIIDKLDLNSHLDYTCQSILLKILTIGEKNKDFYGDKHYGHKDLFTEYQEYSIEKIKKLVYLIYNSSEKYNYFIKNEYKDNNIDKVNNQLYLMLQDSGIIKKNLDILAMRLQIERIDVIGGENKYKLIPQDQQKRKYLNSKSNVVLDHPTRILLMSDSHIGNNKIQDFDLINNIVIFAINEFGVTECIHLGDIFEGIKLDKGPFKGLDYNNPEVRTILYNQIQDFYNYFPDNIKTLALEGNHDTSIINFLQSHYIKFNYLNVMALSLLKPNFRLIRAYEFGHVLTLNNFKLRLNHRFQYNMFENNVKTTELDTDPFIADFKNLDFDQVDLSIFGHFHYSTHRTLLDNISSKKKEYEVIPSISKLNINSCVAKILEFNYDSDNNIIGYSLIPIYATSQKQIYIGEKVSYHINSNQNESIKKRH